MKWVNFMVCQLYLNKGVKKKVGKKDDRFQLEGPVGYVRFEDLAWTSTIPTWEGM